MEIDPAREEGTIMAKTLENEVNEGLVATCSPGDFIESEMVAEESDSKDKGVGETSSWETLRNCFALCCFFGVGLALLVASYLKFTAVTT